MSNRNPREMKVGLKVKDSGCVLPWTFATHTDAMAFVMARRAFKRIPISGFRTADMTDAEFEREYHVKRS